MDFRLKRIQAETWVERSIRAWDEYTKAGGTGTMMELIHIHLLFSAGKEEEACFLLDRIEQQRNHLTAPEQQGYFLYLTTFYNKDKKYIDYVEEKLGELSLRNPENWKLTWFLLYIRENYLRHPGQKLDAIPAAVYLRLREPDHVSGGGSGSAEIAASSETAGGFRDPRF